MEQLPWLFTGTFLAMLLAVPLFGALSDRYPRRTLLPIVYTFFIACILVLFAVVRSAPGSSWAPAAFFIWVSVFNLFVVSVFWSFMADLWREEQARRLFGLHLGGRQRRRAARPGARGRAGAADRPAKSPADRGRRAGRRADLRRTPPPASERGTRPGRRGGRGRRARRHVLLLRSRYLLGICAFMAIATTLSTFVYFQQAQIIRLAYPDAGDRTAVFATIGLAVNALTIGTQLLLTARVISRFSLTRTLPVLPVLSLLGFAARAAAPAAAVLVPFQITRRAAQYAISGPAREILFTVTSREEKYKART